MRSYREKKRAKDPVKYAMEVNTQMQIWRLNKKVALEKNGATNMDFQDNSGDDIPDCEVEELYFDPPGGITFEELCERKRLRMVKFPVDGNNVDFRYKNMSEFMGSKQYNIHDSASIWGK